MVSNWIWQSPDWPQFHWDEAVIQPRLRTIWLKSGTLIGKANGTDLATPLQTLDQMLANILASSAIENEVLDVQSVRSSLARRLGVSEEQPFPVSDRSEGVAELLVDAIENLQPLTQDSLFRWHRWLFPEGDQALSLRPQLIGQLRGPEPMQVVSGRIDRPRVHFEAPPRDGLEEALQCFVDWFNNSQADPLLDPLLRAALSHLWFITLHPFDDGNGRITRALTDRALAQADSQSIRLYAMSAAILAQRADYYRILEQTQRGTTDVTGWLLWFLQTLEQTLDSALANIDRTLGKTRFWQRYQSAGLGLEQIKVLNRLLDGGEKGFEDGISAAQYQKVAKVSKATATRHLADLVQKGCLEKLPAGGRSTRYRIHF